VGVGVGMFPPLAGTAETGSASGGAAMATAGEGSIAQGAAVLGHAAACHAHPVLRVCAAALGHLVPKESAVTGAGLVAGLVAGVQAGAGAQAGLGTLCYQGGKAGRAGR